MVAGLIGGQNGGQLEDTVSQLSAVVDSDNDCQELRREPSSGNCWRGTGVGESAGNEWRLLAKETLDESPPPVLPDLPPVTTLAVVEPPSFNICVYDWPCAEAERIVFGFSLQCPTGESAGNEAAISWDGSSYGLWQINAIHFWRWPNAWSEWMLPEVNTAWAWELYQEQGWGIWACA